MRRPLNLCAPWDQSLASPFFTSRKNSSRQVRHRTSPRVLPKRFLLGCDEDRPVHPVIRLRVSKNRFGGNVFHSLSEACDRRAWRMEYWCSGGGDKPATARAGAKPLQEIRGDRACGFSGALVP